jgi:hypothetical protein
MKDKIVFISYSWDSEEHKQWVLKLANYLISKGGLDIILDQYDLIAGKDMNYFMENGLETADKVLMILTPNYKLKANKREGGTGFEYSIISGELYDIQKSNNKLIPILREGSRSTSSPTYLKTKIYHSMKVEEEFEIDAFELTRIIYEEPKLIRPKKGKKPDFDNPSLEEDPIISIANQITAEEKLNNKLDRLKSSPDGKRIAIEFKNTLFNKLEEKAKLYTEKTELNFNVEIGSDNNQIVISSNKHSVSIAYEMNFYKASYCLLMRFWIGHVRIAYYIGFYLPDQEPKMVLESQFDFDFSKNEEPMWKDPSTKIHNNESLVKMLFEYLIKAIQKQKSRGFR